MPVCRSRFERSQLGVLIALGVCLSACAGRVQPIVAPVAVPVVRAAAAEPVVVERQADPVTETLSASSKAFEQGQQELQVGHLERARGAFNRAVEILLEFPLGVQGDPRLREQFDRLVERISAYEVTALAQGDGFVEKRYEPASIDELLTQSTFGAPDATAATRDAVSADLQNTTHDIAIPLNARVLAFVELFTGRLRNYLEDGLGRAARFLPMIQEVFRAEGLPLDLAYVPLIESAFKPNALSRANARGIWQFMKGTGLENGLKTDWYIDERAEPEKATRAAAKYLKTLYGMFGDWHLALASYNGGPGRVQRAMKRSGLDDFWRLSASSRYLPQETRDYVPLILAAVIVARNPAQYGLEVQPMASPAFETLRLPQPADIRKIAEWAGTSVSLIQDLNPELRRWTTPVRANDYEVRVPDGTASLVLAHLEDEASAVSHLNWYTVRKGETLLTIARKLKVSRNDLAEANYVSATARVRPGQRLVVPRAPTPLLATAPEALAAASRPEKRRADVVVASNVATSRASRATSYQVRRGDTLASIARAHGVTVSALKDWNRLATTTIRVGERLVVRRAPVTATD